MRQALVKLNPGLPEEAYDSAIKQITETSVAKAALQINREKYELLKNGVPVAFRNGKGEIEKQRLRVFDFAEPEKNHFLVVGDGAKLGSLSSKYEHFHEWKRLHEEDSGVVDLETLLKGVCSKRNFMDIFRTLNRNLL